MGDILFDTQEWQRGPDSRGGRDSKKRREHLRADKKKKGGNGLKLHVNAFAPTCSSPSCCTLLDVKMEVHFEPNCLSRGVR